MNINLWKHQQYAIQSITESKSDKCLIKMFCGTGKTRIIFYLMMRDNDLSVIIFPSIALISQFNKDYIQRNEWESLTSKYKYLSICSVDELHFENIVYTTNMEDIIEFIEQKEQKIIAVTYQSFPTFIDSITQTKTKINLLIYDEAHHVIGNTIQKLAFGNNIEVDKTLFFTATPKNDNGIRMLERKDNEIYTDCGELTYEYTHYQAVENGRCNDFNIAIDFYTDNTIKYKSIYQTIVRSVFQSSNNRVLTFHYRSITAHESKSNVDDFVTPENILLFKEEFQLVLENEFPQLKNKYSVDRLTITGLTCNSKNRLSILQEFEDAPDNHVYILSSCQTIGEGVDTKRANQICFVDPRTSYTTIIQNIGRCCRLPQKDIEKATILIPCYVDANKYENCQTQEEKDTAIREDMNESGNFNPILNVLSALRTDDPELYDLCLNYPNSYTADEIKKTLGKQGYRIDKYEGDLVDVIEYITDQKVDNNDNITEI